MAVCRVKKKLEDPQVLSRNKRLSKREAVEHGEGRETGIGTGSGFLIDQPSEMAGAGKRWRRCQRRRVEVFNAVAATRERVNWRWASCSRKCCRGAPPHFDCSSRHVWLNCGETKVPSAACLGLALVLPAPARIGLHLPAAGCTCPRPKTSPPSAKPQTTFCPSNVKCTDRSAYEDFFVSPTAHHGWRGLGDVLARAVKLEFGS